MFNDAALLLTLAIADKALVGIDTFEDLFDQQTGEGEDFKMLLVRDDAMELPILCSCTEACRVTRAKWPRSSFLQIFKQTLVNAGYFSSASIHQIRRNLGKKLDGGHLFLFPSLSSLRAPQAPPLCAS